jgi:hypothetical protein
MHSVSSSGTSGSGSRSGSAAGSATLSSLDVQTLDGRVPTVEELRQRKHVLKKALHRLDAHKAAARANGGQGLSAQQAAHYEAMYAEYKEVKSVLAAVEEADAAEQQQQQLRQQGGAASAPGGAPRGAQHAPVIDLT